VELLEYLTLNCALRRVLNTMNIINCLQYYLILYRPSTNKGYGIKRVEKSKAKQSRAEQSRAEKYTLAVYI